MSERLDSYLTQWVRDLAVGHTLTEADRKVLDRVVLALQSADKHHSQARAAQAIVEAAALFAAIMVDGDAANVPMRDMMRARDQLIALCFGDQKFEKSAQLVAAYMAKREAA